MKTAFLLIACLLPLACLAQQIPENPNKTDKKGKRQGKWTLTYNADWQPTKAKDSIVYYRLLTYQADKPQGLTTDYYASGKKQWEARLTADRPKEIIDGKAIWYHENGAVSSSITFAQGLREGEELAYYPNGQKLSEAHYKNDSIINKKTYYNEAGEVNNVEYYANNEKLSLQKVWNKAIAFYNNAKYQEAEVILSDIYVAFKNEKEINTEYLVYTLQHLWSAQHAQGKNKEALKNISEMCVLRDAQKVPKDSTYRDWLMEIAKCYKATENLAQVEAPLLKIIQIQTEITGKDHEKTLAYQRTLGDYYRYQERYNDAEKVYTENINSIKKMYPAETSKYSYELAALGSVCEYKQNYEKAEKLYKEALKNYEDVKDTTAQAVYVLKKLMSLYQAQNKNKEALPLAQALVALQKIRKGSTHADYSEAIGELIQTQKELELFAEAEILIEERLRIEEANGGLNTTTSAHIIFTHALLLIENKQNQKAEAKFLESLALLKKIGFEKSEYNKEKQAEVLAYLGEFYTLQNDVLKADAVFVEAQDMIKKIVNKDQLTIAQIYQKIGVFCIRNANYVEAEDAFKESERINKKLFGEQHHNYMIALSNLCLVYNYTKRTQLAIDKLEALAQSIVEKNGKDNHSYITVMNTLMISYDILKKHETAIKIRNEIVAFYLKNYGDMSSNYQLQLAKLVMNQVSAKKLQEAQENLDKLQLLADKKGIKTIDKFYYEDILSLKILLANYQSNYAKAIEYAKEAHAIGKFLGQPKSGVIQLSLNSFMAGKPQDATRYSKMYIDLVLEDVRKVFPYLSENQRVGFYSSEMQYHLDMYYYFALAEPLNLSTDSIKRDINKGAFNKIHYIKHPNNADIFNYQLITKGLLFESSQKMKQSILNSQDEGLIKLFHAWQKKKEDMNRLFNETDSKTKETNKNKINAEIKAIEKELALKSSFFNQKNENKNYTWRDVQKKLKKGEALVEVLAVSAGQKMTTSDYKTSDLYLAFVITADTKDYPLCVKIGVGDTLEGKYIRNYQNCIKAQSTDKYSYKKYWKILADTLNGIQKIYFAPDGLYHHVNINTLQNPETGKFVIEEKEIQFITQARDFIALKNEENNLPTNITLFGSPNFNNLPADSTKNTERTVLQPIDRAFAQQIAQDTTQRFLHDNKISELPGTETEVNNVATIFQPYKLATQTYIGNEANEENLKNTRNPAILHIATHGFFMTEKHIETTVQDEGEQRSGYSGFSETDLKNPLRRCGLLLAYCKQAFSREKYTIKLPEDGILTAEEAQNLHLDKTELVVLSACETGLGEVKNGEGVYGLQRAFQTAGAKSVLMSLWTVNDQATQELMTAFYTHWFKTKNKRVAFRKAQLELKEKYPQPYFWGAFILVGE